ncbi:MAG: hypothetical protein QXU13_01010 [Desulfurococcaceae archaeon]
MSSDLESLKSLIDHLEESIKYIKITRWYLPARAILSLIFFVILGSVVSSIITEDIMDKLPPAISGDIYMEIDIAILKWPVFAVTLSECLILALVIRYLIFKPTGFFFEINTISRRANKLAFLASITLIAFQPLYAVLAHAMINGTLVVKIPFGGKMIIESQYTGFEYYLMLTNFLTSIPNFMAFLSLYYLLKEFETILAQRVRLRKSYRLILLAGIFGLMGQLPSIGGLLNICSYALIVASSFTVYSGLNKVVDIIENLWIEEAY